MKFRLLLAACSLVHAAIAQTLVTDFPVTNGSVEAVLYVPETNEIVIGGSFTRIGPFTGSFVGLDRTTGEWNTPSFPKPNGPVLAALPDGQGGWYLGGEFTEVGGQPRESLAHILPNGTVDPAWAPPSGPTTLPGPQESWPWSFKATCSTSEATLNPWADSLDSASPPSVSSLAPPPRSTPA